ncbi:manganese efflux pump MntP family protein [Paraclostridium tenue]|uniref:Putative manganese efflux pump MntP n=1 Tax=Paraclostridium tenue TaxID=1737 RepID=A0ABN1M342_9FIRM
MNITFVLMTSFALSMDAFTVSLSKGMNVRKIDFKLALKISLAFGLFQGLMPLLGWSLGIRLSEYIKSIDHWIAFILLCFLGYQMIFSKDDKNNSSKCNNLDIFILAIATSIDALAVGISFSFLNIPIIPMVICIGIITFSVCFIGVLIGNKMGAFIGKFAKFIGGIILILIGFNIFNEHTNFIRYFM